MLLEHFLEVLQKHPFSLLPQIPQNWEGSGALKHGSGFLRKPDPIFGNGEPFFFGQNGGLFWVKFESTPQMGVLSGVKMGELLAAPESYLLPLLLFYLRDFLV